MVRTAALVLCYALVSPAYGQPGCYYYPYDGHTMEGPVVVEYTTTSPSIVEVPCPGSYDLSPREPVLTSTRVDGPSYQVVNTNDGVMLFRLDKRKVYLRKPDGAWQETSWPSQDTEN